MQSHNSAAIHQEETSKAPFPRQFLGSVASGIQSTKGRIDGKVTISRHSSQVHPTGRAGAPSAGLSLILQLHGGMAHRERLGRAAHQENKKIPRFVIWLDKTGERCCAVT